MNAKKLLCLIISLILLCPAVSAANRSSPALRAEERQERGDVRLTLENLGNRSVVSVQLELTLDGEFSRPSFTAGGDAADSYCCLRVEEEDGQTRLILYLDSLTSLNRDGEAALGTLRLGARYEAPDSARVTLLDRSLEASSRSISVRSASGGTEEPDDSLYPIRVAGSRHGTVSVRPGRAEAGDTVTVTARPDSGFRLDSLTASAGQRRLPLRDLGDGVYTFTMPAAAVEVEGLFTAQSEQPLPFTDVPEGVWFHDAVRYVYENGLMSGTTPTAFSPDLSANRGMIVFILYKLAGSPETGVSPFTDVPAGAYYSGAAAWASASGIISGYGDGRFGPGDPVTREQLAMILRSYARLNGRDVSAQTDLSVYADAGLISGYAREAVSWACAQGLISGTSSVTLTPAGTATRSQTAMILQKFCETVLK